MNVVNVIASALKSPNERTAKMGKQALLCCSRLSTVIETYLEDNGGRLQNLDNFPMMRDIYNNIPQKMILKCSRKTLKSTLISNILALNLIRYDHYKMLYVAPKEAITKYFSSNYLLTRLRSRRLQKLYSGLSKDDVFEKTVSDTQSSVILRYATDDASRIRGPATDHNVHDEVQSMDKDILPIIAETMAMSPYKREIFSGTPLTTDNTINQIWRTSNQLEWMFKCKACNHWNSLTEDNNPLKMISLEGLCCSKCSRLISTREGLWSSFNSGAKNLVGYHLAQPILPYYNEDKKGWKEIYTKVTAGKYSQAQIYNEVFGLALDVGQKPITQEALKALCQLGEINLDKVQQNRYRLITCGVDWGVNMQTSRTSVCLGGLRDDMVYEVFYLKTFRDYNYEKQIQDIADIANRFNAFCAADSGPDPMRGIKLIELTAMQRTQLVRYTASQFIQYYDSPAQAISPTQNRWCLHRSDTFGLIYRLLKSGKILFPRWEDSAETISDILNVYIENKEGLYRQETYYRHKPDAPDDFMHALNYAVCQAYTMAGDPLLHGPSTSVTYKGD
jgi:hypothetical protein